MKAYLPTDFPAKEVLDMTRLGLRYVREAEEREERARNVARAEEVVRFVENIANNGHMSIEESCRMCGTDILYYTGAKAYLQGNLATVN